MKRTLIATAWIAGLTLSATTSRALIEGSAHDFSGEIWSGGEICAPCHAPHNNQSIGGELLWNHDPTTESFTMYGSLTMDAVVPAEPMEGSKRCLSCHDGTVALDAYGGIPGFEFITGTALISSDLSNDHPISILYSEAFAGGDLHPDSADSNVAGGTTIAADMLTAGRVECDSCHDVHNEFGLSDLLKTSNDGSALCLTCHDK